MRAFAGVALLAAAFAGGCLAAGAQGGETTVEVVGWRPYEPRWEALALGTGERRLEIGVTESSCGSRKLRLVLHESRHAVRVSVSAEAAEWSGPVSCPGPHPQPHTVLLRHPLAGRDIEGQRPSEVERLESGPGAPPGGPMGNVVPRLIGFSPGDARAALLRLSLRAHLVGSRAAGGLRRVAGQRPAPGTFVARGGAVRLTVAG
jgi:hypothetical protein